MVNESKASLIRIESELKKVSDGTRVSARTFEKYDVDQLRPLVATLFEELHSCKDQLSKSVYTLESEFDYWSQHPTYLRDALTHLKSNEIIINLDKQLLKIEQSHIDLTAQFKCQMTELKQLKTSVTSQPPLLTQAELQQCHSVQLKELKDLTTAINSQPKPLPGPQYLTTPRSSSLLYPLYLLLLNSLLHPPQQASERRSGIHRTQSVESVM